MQDHTGKIRDMPLLGWLFLGIAALVSLDRLPLVITLTVIIFLIWKFRSKFRRAWEWAGENIRKQLNK